MEYYYFYNSDGYDRNGQHYVFRNIPFPKYKKMLKACTNMIEITKQEDDFFTKIIALKKLNSKSSILSFGKYETIFLLDDIYNVINSIKVSEMKMKKNPIIDEDIDKDIVGLKELNDKELIDVLEELQEEMIYRISECTKHVVRMFDDNTCESRIEISNGVLGEIKDYNEIILFLINIIDTYYEK